MGTYKYFIISYYILAVNLNVLHHNNNVFILLENKLTRELEATNDYYVGKNNECKYISTFIIIHRESYVLDVFRKNTLKNTKEFYNDLEKNEFILDFNHYCFSRANNYIEAWISLRKKTDPTNEHVEYLCLIAILPNNYLLDKKQTISDIQECYKEVKETLKLYKYFLPSDLLKYRHYPYQKIKYISTETLPKEVFGKRISSKSIIYWLVRHCCREYKRKYNVKHKCEYPTIAFTSRVTEDKNIIFLERIAKKTENIIINMLDIKVLNDKIIIDCKDIADIKDNIFIKLIQMPDPDIEYIKKIIKVLPYLNAGN